MNLKGIKKKLLRFKSIFVTHWISFTIKHPRYNKPYYHSEIKKMMDCGSEALGFATFQCLSCGKGEHTVNFSCKGKACPQCGKRYSRESMEKIASRLLPGVSYRQVVLTLPCEFRNIFYNHPEQGALYSELMSVGHACLEALIQDLLRCNTLKIASIVFIHTHGRNGSYNPHLHILLGEGGLNPMTNQWLPISYLPLSRLRLKWQAHLLHFMAARIGDLNGVIKALWVKHPKGFYAHPGNGKKVPTKHYRGLLKYLTKYLASPPIGVSRITRVSDGCVSYYYQSHRSKQREYECVEAEVFIGRMVQHILPKGFQRIRYYGLQATASFKKWYEIIAMAVGDLVDGMISYVSRLKYCDFFREVAGRNPLVCAFCGDDMELVRLYHPDRGVFYDIFSP
jgi:hypothetical protein